MQKELHLKSNLKLPKIKGTSLGNYPKSPAIEKLLESTEGSKLKTIYPDFRISKFQTTHKHQYSYQNQKKKV